VNLFLALLWLTLALATFLMSWAGSESPFLRVGGAGPHIGWFALMFCAYNLVRWFSLRMLAQRRRLQDEQRRYRPRREPAPQAPDPAFDFSDRPPPPGEGIRPPR
jgi:hypothetical protein